LMQKKRRAAERASLTFYRRNQISRRGLMDTLAADRYAGR
jgi:hypothetical protein